MPQIIVKAEGAHDRGDSDVMLRERVNVADFESERFAVNLVERLGWAVSDAAEAERSRPPEDDRCSSDSESHDNGHHRRSASVVTTAS
jgi:hypothetical protein